MASDFDPSATQPAAVGSTINITWQEEVNPSPDFDKATPNNMWHKKRSAAYSLDGGTP